MTMRPLHRASWTSALAAALLLAVAAGTVAPARAADTPEQVAKKVADATKAADWKAFSALFHPDALAELKKLLREITAEESTREMSKMFLGVTTPAELDKMTSEQVFERFMGTISTQIPGFADALKSADIQIVGHLEEKPDLAYVVTRNTVQVGELKMTKMEVISLRKQGDTWKALLSGSMEGFVAQIRQLAKAKAGAKG
jgi:hypothetical protein